MTHIQDNLDDRAICEWMAEFIAREIAAEIRDDDPMYSPWGGIFSRRVYAVPAGNC